MWVDVVLVGDGQGEGHVSTGGPGRQLRAGGPRAGVVALWRCSVVWCSEVWCSEVWYSVVPHLHPIADPALPTLALMVLGVRPKLHIKLTSSLRGKGVTEAT